jgi:hypothetical protein
MSIPIRQLIITRYYRDRPGWNSERIDSASWSDVEAAVRRMDNYCFPIVQLNTTEDEENEDIFNVCGGAGRLGSLPHHGRMAV